MYSRQELDQPTLVIHFFATTYERRVRLLANASTVKSPVIVSMIPAFRPSRHRRVTVLAETVLHLLLIPTGWSLLKVSNVETFRLPLEIFAHRERLWHHDRCIAKTTVNRLLIGTRRQILAVGRTQRIVQWSRNRKIFGAQLD